MDYASFLKNVPLFASLKPTDLDNLARITKVNKYKKGDSIFHQADPGSTLYIIASGQVKITVISPEGDEIILAILTDGDFFGELSLLDQHPRSANVVTMMDTQAIVLHQHDLLNFLSTHPELAIDIMAELSRRLREANTALEDAVFLNLPTRLAKRLLELGQKHGVKTDRGIELGLHLTQQDLADMVGASRVAVNKQLKMFKIKGLIDAYKRQLIITRPEELGKYTDVLE